MAPMASMLARVGRKASARSLSALSEAATALPAAAAASRAARSGNAGGVPILDGRSVASKSQFFGWAHHEGRRLLCTNLFHGVDSVAGHEDHGCPGIMKLDDKDIESDEALWALYHRWCKYFNVERSHEDMIHRFDKFKTTVLRVHKAKSNSLRTGINSLADRSLDEFTSRGPIVTYEAYLVAKAMEGCIITSDSLSDED